VNSCAAIVMQDALKRHCRFLCCCCCCCCCCHRCSKCLLPIEPLLCTPNHFSLTLKHSGGCEENTGRDQPCVVVAGNWKGKCLVNRWKPTCTGGHSSSRCATGAIVHVILLIVQFDKLSSMRLRCQNEKKNDALVADAFANAGRRGRRVRQTFTTHTGCNCAHVLRFCVVSACKVAGSSNSRNINTISSKTKVMRLLSHVLVMYRSARISRWLV
jgi:hypothetical protein